ncbi:PadR family transcriptional regulator [Anaerosporobacter faecicola]|uniref:PadR family transcriptional regulator n=1 Tax=Anaerosporobacter faecicola TaxID=2718714 RepID=UPI001439D719|nr:PadR family transcriptional regulator [Anaerosporobacter faecicola]
MLEFIVLGIINYEDMTGYDIKKFIDQGIGVFYKASFGSLYPILRRLTEKKLVTMYEGAKGERVKNYYQITKEGRNAFMEWLVTPIQVDDGKGTQLVKIYFYDLLDSDTRRNLLAIYREKNIQYLNQLYELEKKFSALPNKECYYYKISVLYYGIRVMKETIAWCDDIMERKEL